jgi:hypothetical protein
MKIKTIEESEMIKIYHNVSSFSSDFTKAMSSQLKNHCFIRINQDGHVVSKYIAGKKI